MASWTINIDNFLGGYAPNWHAETYPSYGNRNMAGAMLNADLTNAGFLTQGPGLSTLTNGTEAGAVSTLIKAFTPIPEAASFTYAGGENKIYQINDVTVVTDSPWPLTVDGGGTESIEDIVIYKNNIYYSYNVPGVKGDIGKVSLAGSSQDDDYMSTTPTGFAAMGASVGNKQMIIGGNDVLYITNDDAIATFDGTTFVPEALDFPSRYEAMSIAWNRDRLWIGAKTGEDASLGFMESSILVWDGTTSSWEAEIRVNGVISALFEKDGQIYLWYQHSGRASEYRLARVNGPKVEDLAQYTDGETHHGQIMTYRDFIVWAAGSRLYAYGKGDKDLPERFFQIADGGYSTVGGIASAGSRTFVASTESSSFKVASFANYDTSSNWKSMLFDISGREGKITGLRVNFETLATGARVDWTLRDNNGRAIVADKISFAKHGAANTVFYNIPGQITPNCRLEFDFSNGSATNPVKIKSAKIYGETT